MPGTQVNVKDIFGIAGGLRQLVIQLNKAVTDLGTLQARNPNSVILNVGAGISVDANAEDVEMDNAIALRWQGNEYPFAQEDPIDLSTKTLGGDTITTSKSGAAWIFADIASGVTDAETASGNSATTATALEGLAKYSMGSNTLPPTVTSVPIGVVSVVEGGSGTFTWGTDSITAETEVYYSFRGVPTVLTAAASFAASGGATATFAYGAGKCRLGTGTIVSYTGKTGVAFDAVSSTNVTAGLVGVWFLYVLADDSEIAAQFGGAGYTSLALAQAAVRAHNPNPLLPIVGIIYLQNNSGAAFVPATTNLNVAGLTTTFEIVAAGRGWLHGGAVAADLTAAYIGAENGTVISV